MLEVTGFFAQDYKRDHVLIALHNPPIQFFEQHRDRLMRVGVFLDNAQRQRPCQRLGIGGIDLFSDVTLRNR